MALKLVRGGSPKLVMVCMKKLFFDRCYDGPL